MYMYRATAVHGRQVPSRSGIFSLPGLVYMYLPTWLILWRANSILQFSGPPLSHTQNRVGCAMLDAVSQRLVPAMYLSHVEFLSLSHSLAVRRNYTALTALTAHCPASLPLCLSASLPIALGTEETRRGNIHQHQHKHSRACHSSSDPITHSLVLLIHTSPVDIHFVQFHSATDLPA
ncbi:hypothetical protein F5Y07DRAFT_320612 [Xylaria sp. FL0933]|nr:hypothetical protein F5Y07DRAFT_320612 [Xylaria sp. FL0933]